MKVLILGASGMLGHRVAEKFGDEAIALTRQDYEAGDSLAKYELTKDDWIINCIGVIPQKNTDSKTLQRINGKFPRALASHTPAKVLQIATDCVFSGSRGNYAEDDNKDSKDDYGRSKIMGEHPSFMNIRTSIVGAELSGKKSLFEWVRSQPEGAQINGYINHFWNGVTTDAFARIAKGIVKDNIFWRGTHHLIPAGIVSKYQLIKLMIERADRQDIEIMPTLTNPVNRTLATLHPYLNQRLWELGGYCHQPTIQELIGSMKVE